MTIQAIEAFDQFRNRALPVELAMGAGPQSSIGFRHSMPPTNVDRSVEFPQASANTSETMLGQFLTRSSQIRPKRSRATLLPINSESLTQTNPLLQHSVFQGIPRAIRPLTRLPANQDLTTVSQVATRLGIQKSGVLSDHIAYRIILTLLEREQITVARQTLAALPVESLGKPIFVELFRLLAKPSSKPNSQRDFDRQNDYAWIRTNAQTYRGKWVALHDGKLLASAESLHSLLDQLKRLSRRDHEPLIHQIQ